MANRDRYGLARRDQGAMLPFGGDLFTSPFTVMRRMADEMNQLFNAGMSSASQMMPFGSPMNLPNIDVRETAGSYVVEAEMPGVRAKDVDVSVQGDNLVIRGQSSRSQEQKEQGYYLSERHYGSFYREVPLPGPVNPDACSAHFEDGVLEVRLPKAEEAGGKHIRVNEGQGQGQSMQVQQSQQSSEEREKRVAQEQQAGKQGPGQTVPGTAERASQPGVEASTADQSYVGVGSGQSAREAAQAFEEEEEEQKTGSQQR